jgi:hypothetical protein
MLGASRSGGPCDVTLPETATVVDLATGATLSGGESRFTVNLRPKEVRIFLVK